MHLRKKCRSGWRRREGSDFISVERYISYHLTSDLETGEHLKLITAKGVFSFNSYDYQNFNSFLELLFQDRKDLKQDFHKQVKKYRKMHIDHTWIYYGGGILILLVLYFL